MTVMPATRCRGVGQGMNGEAEETRELEVAYPVGTLHVRYPDGTLAISEDDVEPGQGSRRARGQVREAAGRVAGVDDDGPAARQGEHELGPRAGGAGKQQARRRAYRGAPRPAHGAERGDPGDGVAGPLPDQHQEIRGEVRPVGLSLVSHCRSCY